MLDEDIDSELRKLVSLQKQVRREAVGYAYEQLLKMPTLVNSRGDELKVDEPGVRRVWVSDASRVSGEVQVEWWCDAESKWKYPVTIQMEG